VSNQLTAKHNLKAEITSTASESPKLAPDAKSPTYDQHVLNTAKGGGIITIGRLYAYANRFVITLLLARLLGAEQYGVYSLALSVAAITSTISMLGLDDAVMRYVAIYSSRRDESGLWGALQVSLGTSLLLGVMLGAALFLLADIISVNLFHEPKLTPLIRLISIVIPFLTLSEMLMFATRGFKKMEYSVIAENFVQLTLRLVLIVALGMIGLNAYLAVIVFGISDVAASIVLVFFLNKEFTLRRPLNTARRDTREIYNFALPFWLSDLISTFRGHFQTILLGSLTSVMSAGIFAVVNKVNLLGHMSYRSITTSSRPIIAELQSNGEWEQVGRLYKTISRWALTLNVPLILIMMLFPKQLLGMFGSSFTVGSSALIILALAELVIVITGMSGPIIDMTGHNKLKMVNSVTQVIISLGMNILLIPRWGLLGAALAALISITYINFLRMIEVYFLYRMLPYNQSLLKPLTAGLVTLVVTLVITRWFPDEAGFLYLAMGVVLILVIDVVMLQLLGFPPEERMVLGRARQRASTVLSQGQEFLKRQLNSWKN
jgi:O-antigen/teichoic acid export membrane protein